MRFGPVATEQAEGAVLAHTVRLAGNLTLKKGQRLTSDDVAALKASGLSEVIAARLDPGDLDEDRAAARLAEAVGGTGIRVERAATGRANLFAATAGILTVDAAAVDRFNRIDDGITIATLPAFRAVQEGEMIATVKIIPFAVPQAAVEAAATAVPQVGLAAVRPYRGRPVGVVSTILPQTTDKMLEKTARVLADRLAPAGAQIIGEVRVAHEAPAVAEALKALDSRGAELLLVYGASAIVDRHDVIPQGIEQAGGRVVHFGMPVDPGNLLLIGDLGGRPVLGAPGCARSPKENGFDWVLQRLLADIPVGAEDIMGMGVGGLLMEIVSRPQPREGAPERPGAAVAAIVLAAGRSRRMGGPNKLLETVGGRPLVRIATEAALASRADPVIVVTGHQADQVRAALAGLDVRLVHNPDYFEGLSTSLRAGIDALPETAGAALVCLADMPGVTPQVIDRLIDAHDPSGSKLIAVPTVKGKRGNPVLWSRRFFPALSTIRGDTGARHLIGENADAVVEVEMDERAVLSDVDTPAALSRLRRAHGDET
jgi:molybdenum cofactor cytidylyltransferase